MEVKLKMTKIMDKECLDNYIKLYQSGKVTLPKASLGECHSLLF
jgi:hypothetical protein